MTHAETIVATATPAGRGAIGVVRVSGPHVPDIAIAILGQLPQPRIATHSRFVDSDLVAIDEGLALYFPAPGSSTGDDVLELQGHGSPVVQEQLVARVIELGARRAEPGEFTQRAFENGKLDLAQAEAVADLIAAGSAAGARAAMRSLRGKFSARVNSLAGALTDLRTYVEAAIDFPDEGIDYLATDELTERVTSLRQQFDAVQASTTQGSLITHGVTVVIAGRPNAGKSTLLNALAGYDAAIVTPVAGTTRDPLREHVDLDGLPLLLIDTAGLREVAGEAGGVDAIEAEGVRRARELIGRADRLLFVIDAAADPEAHAYEEERMHLPANVPVTLVFNKQDLVVAREPDNVHPTGDSPAVRISAATGAGLDSLRAHLKEMAGFVAPEASTFSARARHVEALTLARAHLDAALVHVDERAGDLAAEELRLAQEALGEITGEVSSDELLGRIFSSFCIGK